MLSKVRLTVCYGITNEVLSLSNTNIFDMETNHKLFKHLEVSL